MFEDVETADRIRANTAPNPPLTWIEMGGPSTSIQVENCYRSTIGHLRSRIFLCRIFSGSIENLTTTRGSGMFEHFGKSSVIPWRNRLLASCLSVALSAFPLNAAERVALSIGPIELSLSVTDLEQFAETGEISDNLNFYLKYLTDEEQAELRTFFLERHEIDPVPVAQFLYSPMGELLLDELGELIQTESRANGGQSIRAAAILAASDPQGFSVLSILRQYPSYSVWLNTPQIFEVAGQIAYMVEETDNAIVIASDLAQTQATANGSIDFDEMPDLRQAGSVSYQTRTLTLTDPSRDRTFPVDIHVPDNSPYAEIPVVVISHGLGSHRSAFSHIAEQLASYGFFVAAPEHIGSNYAQQQAMLNGADSEMFFASEFVDRPADIRFLLDELERYNDREFDGRLQLDRVGVLGHSFGGYTALALGGAQIDFDNLERDCTDGVNSVNISMLLQCRALELPRETYNFRDDRVAAVLTANPVNSSIFGERGMASVSVPVLMAGGSLDPVTPLVVEQVQSFDWLETPEKYFALVSGQSHTTGLTALIHTLVPAMSDLIEPDVGLTRNYSRAVPLAFFQVYLLDNENYRPYLSANYGLSIGEKPFDLYLLSAIEQPQTKTGGKSATDF